MTTRGSSEALRQLGEGRPLCPCRGRARPSPRLRLRHLTSSHMPWARGALPSSGKAPRARGASQPPRHRAACPPIALCLGPSTPGRERRWRGKAATPASGCPARGSLRLPAAPRQPGEEEWPAAPQRAEPQPPKCGVRERSRRPVPSGPSEEPAARPVAVGGTWKEPLERHFRPAIASRSGRRAAASGGRMRGTAGCR